MPSSDRDPSSEHDSASDRVGVGVDGVDVTLAVGDDRHALSHDEARRLRTALDDALYRVHEFTHTTGEHRPDGSYVVARRRASSSGHRKVFADARDVQACYDALPGEFAAADVTCASGGRRHMLVWHFAEHPGYDCELVSRQPLTARKAEAGDEE